MNCRQASRLLDDYQAERLGGAIRAAVDEHLGTCPGCRRELDRVRALRERLERLPSERKPARDLWPAIAARLGETPSRADAFGVPWAPIRRVAAAVAVGVLLVFAWTSGRRRAAEPAEETAVQRPSPVPVELARRRDGTIHVYRDLADAFARHRGQGDPVAAAALAAGLEDLERAVREIQAALEQHPRDRALHWLLADAYRRETGWASRLTRR